MLRWICSALLADLKSTAISSELGKTERQGDARLDTAPGAPITDRSSSRGEDMTYSPTLSSPYALDPTRDATATSTAQARASRGLVSSAPVEGSSPRWYLPGRAHIPQPYENHISSGLSEFIQNRTAKKPGSAGFGGSRRHFPVIQTPTQREPQLSTARNVDYYNREMSFGTGNYRRHLGFVEPPRPVERVQRLKHIMPSSSGDGIIVGSTLSKNGSGERKDKQVRFVEKKNLPFGNLNGYHTLASYPEPNLPRLGRKANKQRSSKEREEQTLADTLGRRVKVNTKDFKNSDRAGAQRILRGTPSRVEDEVSLSGESFFGRKVDLITFKRFVGNLAPAPKVPLMESLKRSSTRQRTRETNYEIKTVQDLDNWKHSI